MTSAVVVATCAIALIMRGSLVQAAAIPVYHSQWGHSGAGPGEFNDPWGIAVDDAGFVYVADHGNHRIQKFTRQGVFVAQWGSFGSGPGEFLGPDAVAVDNAGNVYVADHTSHVVQRFDTNGALQAYWFAYARCVAAMPGRVYVTNDLTGRLEVFDPDGNMLTSWSTFTAGDNQPSSPWGVVIPQDRTRVYVADYSDAKMKVYEHGGNPIDRFTITSNSDFEWLACDPDGNIYTVITGVPGGGLMVFNSAGHDVFGIFGAGTGPGQFGQVRGVAVDRDGIVYVVDSGNNRIQRFGPAATPAHRSSWAAIKALYR